MTDEELDRIEALANAATAGPWFVTGLPWFRAQDAVLAGSPDGNVAAMVAQCEVWEGERDEWNDNEPSFPLADSRCDAAFIAAAREAVPALIAEVRRLRAKTVEVPVLGKVE